MMFDNPDSVQEESHEMDTKSNRVSENASDSRPDKDSANARPSRDHWGKDIEFLMSCIAMSVGLGNVWRFPFTALQNGGGAFLIPYMIVLMVVGRPIYYLETIVGQFSSRGSVKVFDLCPALRGAGYGQVYAVSLLSTFYMCIMSLIVSYMLDSFKSPLPWSDCRPEWDNCVAAGNRAYRLEDRSADDGDNITFFRADTPKPMSSSELYFIKDVLKEADSLENGIGTPSLQLAMFLFASWIIVLVIVIKGVQTSGKASYFLAIFPYVVMGILLVRAVTLPGASAGIMYFITPQWDKILDPSVWYAAVTQCFFSLSVCFGNIIMYASFNRFEHNIYHDVSVITVMDTITSMIAGCTIFGILGNLAFKLGTDDIQSVVQGGPGLAFISYPEAIAKFDLWPQGFSMLFFFMLFVLGVGSNVAMTSCVMTVIRDLFPKVKVWQAAVVVSSFGFLIGLTYLTPGGQYILNLVDYFGVSFTAFIMALVELAAISWFYGVDRICTDVEFMLGKKTGVYWRICWGILTPLLLLIILVYDLITKTTIMYKDRKYPDGFMFIGWAMATVGIMQLPIWAAVAIIKQPGKTLTDKIKGAFRPMVNWGPIEPSNYEKYNKIKREDCSESQSVFDRFKRNIFG